MTTRSLPSGRQVTLTELPDPPKSPYAMQQRPHIARADQTLRGHYRQRGDALVSGGGYLCYDARRPAPGASPRLPGGFRSDRAAAAD